MYKSFQIFVWKNHKCSPLPLESLDSSHYRFFCILWIKKPYLNCGKTLHIFIIFHLESLPLLIHNPSSSRKIHFLLFYVRHKGFFLKMHSSKVYSLNEMLVLWIPPAPLSPCVTRVCFTGGHCLSWWGSRSLSLHRFWQLPLIPSSWPLADPPALQLCFMRELLVLAEVGGAAVRAERNHSPSVEKDSRAQKRCPHCVIVFWLKRAFCRAEHCMQISWALISIP